jgi:L-alanine-DL-glutamate epimerase-like enolase superfamily enzyme
VIDGPAVAAIRTQVVEHDLVLPFNIAAGGVDVARAVIVEVELADGTIGLGECAPFTAVTGETIGSTLAALAAQDVAGAPAARCGLEVAVLDARLRSAGLGLADWLTPAVDTLTTDITLPITDDDRAMAFVADVVHDGFTTLKVKTGARPVDDDVALMRAIRDAHPGLTFTVDANAAYTEPEASHLLDGLERVGIALSVFEQPMARGELAAMARLQQRTEALVCLDESVSSVADLKAMGGHPDLRSFNVKITKSGLEVALELLRRGRELGAECMIGGMVESKLAMTVSAAMAMHFADIVRHVDLDTPLFMRPGPIRGGAVYGGPVITVPAGAKGHGCSLVR